MYTPTSKLHLRYSMATHPLEKDVKSYGPGFAPDGRLASSLEKGKGNMEFRGELTLCSPSGVC